MSRSSAHLLAACARASLALAALGLAGIALADAGGVAGPELQTALALTPDVERGRSAYASCEICHGADGAGRPDGTFPQLAGQHAEVIMKQLTDIRAGRRRNPLMLPYALRLMDAQEIADVAGYLNALPPPTQNGLGAGTDLELGERVYQHDCRSCHGGQGEGDGPQLVPSLAGQHYGYLLRQIRDIGAGRRGNAHPEMAARVARYDDAELQALVDYASRLTPVAPSSAGDAGGAGGER